MSDQGFIYLDHAKERMTQRGITATEVGDALGNGEAATPETLGGMIRIVGTASLGRRLSIVRLPAFGVIVSAVVLEDPE